MMRKNILKKSAGIFLSATMILSAVSGGSVYAVEDSSILTENMAQQRLLRTAAIPLRRCLSTLSKMKILRLQGIR